MPRNLTPYLGHSARMAVDVGPFDPADADDAKAAGFICCAEGEKAKKKAVLFKGTKMGEKLKMVAENALEKGTAAKNAGDKAISVMYWANRSGPDHLDEGLAAVNLACETARAASKAASKAGFAAKDLLHRSK